MFRFKVFEKLVLSGSFCAAAVVSAEKPVVKVDEVKLQCRSSELPIYPEDSLRRSEHKTEEKIEPSKLEIEIGKIRKFIWTYYDVYKEYQDKALVVIDTGIAHTQATRQLLLEEENYLLRYGAIAIASLSGFVFGLRGGRFKRVTYATIGGLGMAAVCYPNDAKELTQDAIQQAKKYFTISYNFVYGVTPESIAKVSTVSTTEPPASDQKEKLDKSPDTKVNTAEPSGAQHSGSHNQNFSFQTETQFDKIGNTISNVHYWGFDLRDLPPI